MYILPTYSYTSHFHNPKPPQNSPALPLDWRFIYPLPTYNVELDIPTDDLNDERTRPIERGSKIVTIMPSIHAVVLQAPRGNLETISPRALVLASVRQSIAKKEFRTAFLTCRSHRIDMNILHNHQPELFMTNIPLFIQQLRNVEYIDLFLSSLKYSPGVV